MTIEEPQNNNEYADWLIESFPLDVLYVETRVARTHLQNLSEAIRKR